jgi:hypothetical protein
MLKAHNPILPGLAERRLLQVWAGFAFDQRDQVQRVDGVTRHEQVLAGVGGREVAVIGVQDDVAALGQEVGVAGILLKNGVGSRVCAAVQHDDDRKRPLAAREIGVAVDGQAVGWVAEDVLVIERCFGSFLGQFDFPAAVIAHPQGLHGVAVEKQFGGRRGRRFRSPGWGAGRRRDGRHAGGGRARGTRRGRQGRGGCRRRGGLAGGQQKNAKEQQKVLHIVKL